MDDLSARNDDIRDTVEKYRNSILRFAFTYLKNRAEAEDVAQDVFVAYIEKPPLLESEEKKKAWLMQVTANKCRNTLSSVWKKRVTAISDDFAYMPRENAGLLRYVLSLEKKYRVPIHLYYYEGYSIEEISRLTQTKAATVGTRLARGRKKLKDMIGEDFYE